MKKWNDRRKHSSSNIYLLMSGTTLGRPWTAIQFSAFNAFAAMCRRCVQSAATNLGAKGKDKVLRQLQDLKDMAEVDEETYKLLSQIIIEGHDGAHPHLPLLTQSGRRFSSRSLKT
jgi:hypothetical protein